ncbi:FAD-dependent oxidoreductase [Geodermatophilus obscurus]|uniref:FAD dependent oxidoreductase n=1 Tax=Geodermatophilus obscurus (strain ATCC 25078 / DSM 43160 / JCM 3152 / CCUG 61914 / KCC A-0152 / KCTC 9177 / NBRC 13315 / NRRL B-3577 / G-20) TaxID=526225 RepID=D2S578_GEOOG|nr:FAD-dependent oxidoreductase [Geodermatophilus obscurus]ADB73189.1 FAD dependent oxidoreductase [Geodermatophilus obscurus DSM 43160]
MSDARDEDPLSADAVVLGAGISGLVSASVLLAQGARRVIVLDEYAHVGGNHIDRTIGDYTFDIGSLIFQDDSPLLGHFPEMLPRYVPIEPSWSRLNPQGLVTHYPFSIRDDVLGAGVPELLRMVSSAITGRLAKRRQRNVRDFAEHLLGAYFVERSGLGYYMQRLCGLPPEQIDLEFARSRLGWLEDQSSARNLVRRLLRSMTGNPEPPSHNRQLARPREGYGYLYGPAVRSLSERGVVFLLDTAMREIRKDGDRFVVTTERGSVAAPRVVSTIPLDRALRLCGLEAPGAPLPTVTLLSLFCSFSGSKGFQTPILYNFSREGAWKRITVYSDFYGSSGGREFFTVEVIGERVNNSVDVAVEDFRAHCAANGLLVGDLRLEGHHVLDNAYPIYTQGSGQRARDSVRTLRDFGLESLGRQGAFQYQPTARASTVEAERALRPAGP